MIDSLLIFLLYNILSVTPTVQVWAPFEREFIAHGATVPSLREAQDDDEEDSKVELRVEFRGPNEQQYNVLGFWDGGQLWRVRFAPPTAGWWSYRTISSDAALADEANHGVFLAVAASEKQLTQNPNRRGFLKTAAEQRAFTYADGTPFFWLGGTIWAGNSLNMPLADFRHYVHNRQAKGFTIVQLKVADPHRLRSADKTENGRYQYRGWNEGGPLFWRQNQEINAAAFQNLDQRVQMILAAGMVPVLFLHWGDAFDKMPLAGLQKYYSYMVARYQAYNIIWCLSGEYRQSRNLNKINACGRFLRKIDTAGHLITIHPGPGDDNFSSVQHFNDACWLDFHMQHTWEVPERRAMLRDRVLTEKPVVNAEAGYDGLWNHDRARVRREAWTVFMSGGAGYTYGAHGIWAWREKGPDPLQTLHLQSSFDMERLIRFFAYSGWFKLEPLMEWSDNGYCLSGPAGTPVVVYLPQGGTVHVKDADRHPVKTWYSPRTGEFKPAYEDNGFTAPGTEDWVLYIGDEGSVGHDEGVTAFHFGKEEH